MEDDEAFPSFALIRFIISDNPYSNQAIPKKTTNISKPIWIIVRVYSDITRFFSIMATKKDPKIRVLSVHLYEN